MIAFLRKYPDDCFHQHYILDIGKVFVCGSLNSVLNLLVLNNVTQIDAKGLSTEEVGLVNSKNCNKKLFLQQQPSNKKEDWVHEY